MGFDEFVDRYERAYAAGSEEYKMRAALYEERAVTVCNHNRAYAGPDPEGPLWSASINHLADWTDHELKRLRGHKSHRTTNAAAFRSPTFLVNRGAIKSFVFPKEFSWGNLSTITA